MPSGTYEVESGGSGICNHIQLHRKFKTSLDCIGPCLLETGYPGANWLARLVKLVSFGLEGEREPDSIIIHKNKVGSD